MNNIKSNNTNKNLINMLLSAMFLAIGIILPLLTGQIETFGNMLLPMHLPVMLCGLICGWQYGLAVGAIMPFTRTVLFTMPVLYPNAIAMSFELSTYGFVIGILFSTARYKCIRSLYRCLIISMISGRIVWGISMLLLIGVGTDGFTVSAFLAGAFINAVPGIILQLLFIPGIMLVLNRTHFFSFDKHNKRRRDINAR